MELPQWHTFLQQPANFIPNSRLLAQVPALHLSRISQLQAHLPSWNIAAQQTGVGLPGVASNPCTLVGHMSGIEVAKGGNANARTRADQFKPILTSLADEQKIVSFSAQHLTEEIEEWIVVKERRGNMIASLIGVTAPGGARSDPQEMMEEYVV